MSSPEPDPGVPVRSGLAPRRKQALTSERARGREAVPLSSPVSNGAIPHEVCAPAENRERRRCPTTDRAHTGRVSVGAELPSLRLPRILASEENGPALARGHLEEAHATVRPVLKPNALLATKNPDELFRVPLSLHHALHLFVLLVELVGRERSDWVNLDRLVGLRRSLEALCRVSEAIRRQRGHVAWHEPGDGCRRARFTGGETLGA
jgi:hypothetical protein